MNFSLVPFPGEESVPGFRIAGAITRKETVLSLEFVLEGELTYLAIPAPAASPERKDRLWEGTCMELFLAPAGSRSYLEFNLSPAGDWNVYRFDSYREGMREEERVASLPFLVAGNGMTLRLSLRTEIGRILPPAGKIEAGICAVLRSSAGSMIHWALAHPGPRPDFHHRGGFLLTI